MSSDPETLAVYDIEAEAYETRFAAMDTPGLDAFIKAIKSGGRVLDLGCGPGLHARAMRDVGLKVDAIDGSRVMVDRAQANGIAARHALFEEIDAQSAYDGIWANFSLLHLSRDAMPEMLSRLKYALRPGGVFHIGMKLGKGSARDTLGRLYTYYQAEELDGLLIDAGFTPGTHLPGSGSGLDGTVSDWMVVLSYG